MSNIGINIWTVGDALKNPELGGATPTQLDTMPFSVGELSVQGGDTDFAQAELSFGFSVTAADVSAEAELSFGFSVAGGDHAFGQAALVFSGFSVTADGEDTPNIQGGNQALRGVTIESAGYTWGTGEAELEFPLHVVSGDHAFAQAALEFGFSVSSGGQTQVYHGLAWIPGMRGYSDRIILPDDTINVSDGSLLDILMNLKDELTLSESVAYALALKFEYSDEAILESVAQLPFTMHFLEQLALSSGQQLSLSVAFELLSEAILSGEIDLTAEMALSFSSALALIDLAEAHWSFQFAEDLTAAEQFALRQQIAFEHLEALQLSSALNLKQHLTMNLGDTGELVDDIGLTAAVSMHLESHGILRVVVRLDGETFQGWVVSTDTLGFTEYTNFGFNSMAQLGQEYYAANDSGIYKLGGDTDDGENIDAAIRTALMDLSTTYVKDAKHVYFGYTSSGKLVLKVIWTDEDGKKESWYELKHADAPEMRDGKTTIQRGIRSRYWQFELVNKDGADFEVDDLEVYYAVLSRRTRR